MKAAKGKIRCDLPAERVQTPPRLGDTVSPDDESPNDAANGVDDVLAQTVEHVEK